MKTDELRASLRGVIAFPVTPFNSDYSLDVPGLRKNLRLALQHPISAVVAEGGTGVMYSLTPSEHREVVKAVLEEIRGRAPIIGGTGLNGPVAIELARESANLGADAFSRCRSIIQIPMIVGSSNTTLPWVPPRSSPFVYSRDWVNPSPAWVVLLFSRR